MKRSFTSAFSRIGLVIAALGLAASCDDDGGPPPPPPPPPTPTAIAAVSGDGQTAMVGTPLPEPFVVEVTDDDGDPAAGVDVAWAVTGGGGSLSTAASQTNSSGRTSAILTLGSSPGANTATASSAGLTGSPVTFGATATQPPEPTSIETVSGDGQNGKTREALSDPFVVRVLDDQGAPVQGVEVDWTVVAGNGVMLPNSSPTNAAGQASSTFTPGNSLGSADIEASVDGLTGSPRTFSVETTVWLVRLQNIAFVDWNNSSNHTIAVGDTIEWVNLDDPVQFGPHTVTSSSEPAGGAAFDGDLPLQGNRFRFVPEVAGSWEYFCEIHGATLMSGTLTAE